MKLVNLAVNNFRAITGGLQSNQINFSGSNTIFIFGQNNVGKSTFLKAYDFLYNDKSATIDDFHRKDGTQPIEFEVQLEVDEIDLKYIEEKQEKKLQTFKSYLTNDAIISIRKVFSAKKENNGFKVEGASNFTKNPKNGQWEESAFGSIGLSTVFQALMPTPILIKAMPTEEEVEKVVNEILASKAKAKLSEDEFNELEIAREKVKDLQNKMYNPASIEKYKQEVNKHFQQLFADTKIELLESDKVKWTEDKFGKKFNVEFKKQNPDGTLDDSTPSSYTAIGHGAVRSAIFSLLLMRDIAEELQRKDDRKEYLILFEEPELFLYPKILKNLRELIYGVSEENYPYQVLCASHSPQMIDLSKRNSTLIRMAKSDTGTKLFQVKDEDLQNANGARSLDELKQAMYEVLRFNPHICESFYADEVLLVEGPTEEIIVRGILQKLKPLKDIFIVNCGTVNNIPFYQKVYRKFAIRSHVICDTDNCELGERDEFTNPKFEVEIQGTIYKEHYLNCTSIPKIGGLLRVHHTTFEIAHKHISVDKTVKYPENYIESHGKPFNANRYWREILEPNFNTEKIATVPVVSHLNEILEFVWL